MQIVGELFLGLSSGPFSDIARNANRRSPGLICETEPLIFWIPVWTSYTCTTNSMATFHRSNFLCGFSIQMFRRSPPAYRLSPTVLVVTRH
jgi:hypothetical protein